VLRARIEEHIRRYDLIEPAGDVIRRRRRKSRIGVEREPSQPSGSREIEQRARSIRYVYND